MEALILGDKNLWKLRKLGRDEKLWKLGTSSYYIYNLCLVKIIEFFSHALFQ
jgi:hypothetical protein